MSVDSKSIPVNGDGIGSYSFIASGGNYDASGYAKKIWTGKIKMKKPDGQDTVYTVAEEYQVSKPVIQVQLGAVQALYRNCGNKLNVQVPALGNSYNPVFKADGAQIINGQSKGELIVIPTGMLATLKVSSNGNYIGEEKYRVKPIPMPEFDLRVNGQVLDPVIGFPAQSIRSIVVKAKPEKDFKDTNPADATYQISEWTINLARLKGSRGNDKFTSENGNVSKLETPKPGDRIIVEVTKVRRRTFTGAWEEVSFPKKTFIIPLT
jgi:gliding motility-associated protein GldM